MSENTEIMSFLFFEDRTIKSHFHQDVEIVYVLEGTLSQQIEEEWFEMHAGDFVVINSNFSHASKAEKDFLAARFTINYHQLVELLETSHITFWCTTQQEKTAQHEMMRRLLDTILNQYFDKGRETKIYVNSLAYQLIHLLVVHFLVSTERYSRKRSKEKRPRIYEIQNYVEANYQSQISLTDLADKLFLTSGYLSKYIKHQFGVGFVEYLNSIRLHHAVEDLLYTNKTIVKVTMDNGFPNSAAFNKLFRDKYHMTPSAYRKQMHAQKKEEHDKTKDVDQKRIIDYLHMKNSFQEQLESSKNRSLQVDSLIREEYGKIWQKTINIGDLDNLLHSRMQEHILYLKEKLGIQYVRFWNIFQSRMYQNDPEGNEELKFAHVDRSLDFLIQNGIKPYIDLGFKPQTIHKNADTILFVNNQENIFHSSAAYQKTIQRLISHLANRYGVEEMKSWYFELWKGDATLVHPDEELSAAEILDRYFEIFDIGYREIKRISLDIQVGGGGFDQQCCSTELREILRIWNNREIRPDFLSIYSYPYMVVNQNGIRKVKHSANQEYLLNQIQEVRQLQEECGMAGIPLHISEWSSTLSERNILNDSCFKGAYIMKNLIDCLNAADMIIYWSGSDLLGEYYDSNLLLNGCCGLLTADGIRKPAFYGIEFMNHLLPYLLGKDRYSVVTSSGRDEYAIACHNYKHYSYQCFLREEDELAGLELHNLFEDYEAQTLKFRILNVKNGIYKAKIRYININNGSVQDEWGCLNKEKDLMLTELKYLRRVSASHMRIVPITVENGELILETKLLPQEIQNIYISYQY